MEPNYRAFGLTLGSDLALPGLPTTADEPTIRIRRTAVPQWLGEPTVQYGERFRFRGQECAIRFPLHGFSGRVTNGNLIEFESDPTHDDVSRLHVLGSCSGALLFQRGLVPLHGNAVSRHDGSLIVVGRIGAGKSTTTMALLQHGYSLVADDISGIDFDSHELAVAPGYPRIKLWKNTLEQFGLNDRALERVRFDLEKFNYPVDRAFCEKPKKLEAIYVLHPGDSTEVKIRPLSGLEKLESLRPHLYKMRFADAVRNWPPVLAKICRLADSVRVNVLERPSEGVTIEEVAEAIDKDMAQAAESRP